MNSVVIRKATEADMPAVLQLIRDLATYENCAEKVEITLEQLLRDGFGKQPAFNCLVACNGEDVAGFCLSWFRYSTWRGRLLYVEDLFVKEAFRRLGIGSCLLEAKFELAGNLGISQVHLQVLDWNEPAIRFYERYKATFDPGWLNVLISTENQA